MNETDSPITHPVSVSRLPSRGLALTIEATEDQRAELADAHELLQVIDFRAELTVSSWRKDGARVNGRVRARVVQSCIVTLEPVDSMIDEEIVATYVPEGSKLGVPRQSSEGEIVIDAEGEDAPESFSGDTIDVGALVEEFFELGVDPYPRKVGASIETPTGTQENAGGPMSEKLRELRKKL